MDYTCNRLHLEQKFMQIYWYPFYQVKASKLCFVMIEVLLKYLEGSLHGLSWSSDNLFGSFCWVLYHVHMVQRPLMYLLAIVPM